MITINLVSTKPCRGTHGTVHKYANGLGECPACAKTAVSKWRAANKGYLDDSNKIYRASNRCLIRGRAKAYRDYNKYEINAANRDYRADNIDVIRAADKAQYAANKPAAFAYGIKKNYGLTLEEYARMLHSQGLRCASCQDALRSGNKSHVDHCHSTGQVRGILCNYCNVALGMLKDSVPRIEALARYMDKWSVS